MRSTAERQNLRGMRSLFRFKVPSFKMSWLANVCHRSWNQKAFNPGIVTNHPECRFDIHNRLTMKGKYIIGILFFTVTNSNPIRLTCLNIRSKVSLPGINFATAFTLFLCNKASGLIKYPPLSSGCHRTTPLVYVKYYPSHLCCHKTCNEIPKLNIFIDSWIN